MYPTFTGRKQKFKSVLPKKSSVEKQYQEYKMPVYYLANKSGYSFVQLYLPFVPKLYPHG